MEHIVEPDENFDFSNLNLLHPTGIQGGAYFTRLMYNGKPLYIQTPQSKSRQGFVKTGKKYYCDLMFDQNAENIINWFELLEEKCQSLVMTKNSAWFQNSLEKNELESAFNTTLRIYKSGRFYLLRTNIKNNIENQPIVKLFDERSVPVSMEEINSETNIVSILEVQGIKFTSRSFQIEIELKQIMVMDKEPLFDSCLIKTNKQVYLGTKDKNVTCDDNKIDNLTIVPYDTENITKTDETPNLELEEAPRMELQTVGIDNIDLLGKSSLSSTDTNESIDTKFKTEFDNDIKEIQLIVADDLETISLKKPNQVYFELYKEARERAKKAKRNVIVAYLEAKNIKKTYMLDSLDDSDSDLDAEIEEVSESELEGL